MKEKLASLIKYVKWIYQIYFKIGNFFLNVLGNCLRTEENLILFNSFGGKKFDDSPKVLYEAMRQDSRFENCRFVWAFHNPEQFDVDGAECIKTDTLQYFMTALKARCWITNSSMERGLSFKKKDTFCFNTWHGTPIKKMGLDLDKTNAAFKSKGRNTKDVMTVQSDFEAKVFSRAFQIPMESFLKCGLPRNDRLLHHTERDIEKLKAKLNIPADKKIILYAPTFREYERDETQQCVLAPPLTVEKWRRQLSEKFVFLFRAHYEVARAMEIKNDDFIRNVSDYSFLEDLMLVSDILISDYSSIFFDFSIMDKIMLHFTYDYARYNAERGLYFDIRLHLNGSGTEDELLQILQDIDIEKEKKTTQMFCEKYVNYFGNATQSSLECIYEHIKGSKNLSMKEC